MASIINGQLVFHFTYLLLDFCCLIGPLILSFDKRVAFYKSWSALFISVVLVATPFIWWDCSFTYDGVWSFNSAYILGATLFRLPLEEWLFFAVVPYACTFIFEVVRVYWGQRLRIYDSTLGLVLFSIVGTIALFLLTTASSQQLYTRVATTSVLLSLLMNVSLTRLKGLTTFFCAYGLQLIPFFIINGVLTSLPVVSYDDRRNLGIRVGTIPLDDFFYSFSLMLGVCSLFNCLATRRPQA